MTTDEFPTDGQIGNMLFLAGAVLIAICMLTKPWTRLEVELAGLGCLGVLFGYAMKWKEGA